MPAADFTRYGCDALLFGIAKHRVNRAIDRLATCGCTASSYRSPELAIVGLDIRSTAIFESPRNRKHISTLGKHFCAPRKDPCESKRAFLVRTALKNSRLLFNTLYISACRGNSRERELSAAPRASRRDTFRELHWDAAATSTLNFSLSRVLDSHTRLRTRTLTTTGTGKKCARQHVAG